MFDTIKSRPWTIYDEIHAHRIMGSAARSHLGPRPDEGPFCPQFPRLRRLRFMATLKPTGRVR